MTTTTHPAHGSVSLERLHQIREHLLHDTQYSNGGNRAYILADVLKVIDGAIAREQVRSEHAAWSLATFGDVGPVGPLKHLSKERSRLLLNQATLANGLTCSSCYGMPSGAWVFLMNSLPRQWLRNWQ